MGRLFLFFALFFLFLALLARSAAGAAKKVKQQKAQQQETRPRREKAACASLGFNSDTLSCATCSAVLRVVGSEELQQECLSCCTPGAEEERYSHAVLEVDKRFVAAFPELGVILRSILAKKEGKSADKKERVVDIKMDVTHRYSFGARPTLHVYRGKDDSQPADSLSVSAWTVDIFTDFFASHASASSF